MLYALSCCYHISYRFPDTSMMILFTISTDFLFHFLLYAFSFLKVHLTLAPLIPTHSLPSTLSSFFLPAMPGRLQRRVQWIWSFRTQDFHKTNWTTLPVYYLSKSFLVSFHLHLWDFLSLYVYLLLLKMPYV